MGLVQLGRVISTTAEKVTRATQEYAEGITWLALPGQGWI